MADTRSPIRPPRVDVPGVVRVRCPDRQGLHTGFLKDLSHEGMFVRIIDPEPEGTQVGFSFDLGEGGVSGIGEVVWARERYEGPGRPPGMAVRFEVLDAESRRAVSEAVGDDETGEPIRGLVETPPDRERSPKDDPTRTEEGGPAGEARAGEEVSSANLAEQVPGDDSRTVAWHRRGELAAVLLAVAALSSLVFFPGFGDRGPGSGIRDPGPEVGIPASGVQDPELRVRNLESETGNEEEMARTEGQPAEPLSRIVDVALREEESGVVLILSGNGSFEAVEVGHSRIGETDPRIVVRVAGVRSPSPPSTWVLDHSVVSRIRSGFHGESGAGELHLVLDLTSPEIEVAGLRAENDRLLVELRSPTSSG